LVVGLGVDGLAYVLEDLTCKLSPHGWAGRAIAGYYKYSADLIVGEKNYGGAMVESTVRAIDPKVNYDNVNASRGKVLRAEPVAALYGDPGRPDGWHLGRVRHVGSFGEMEEEMTTWYDTAGWSPNRLDALVWGLTELFHLDKDAPTHWSEALLGSA
jgi:phage terminase large subunit-like protein